MTVGAKSQSAQQGPGREAKAVAKLRIFDLRASISLHVLYLLQDRLCCA